MPTQLQQKIGTQTRRTPRSNNRTYTLALIFTVLVLAAISIYVDKTLQQLYRQNLYQQTSQQLHQLSSSLESVLNTTSQSVIGLAAAISAEPDLTQEIFSRQAQYLLKTAPALISLTAAPNMIIKHVYPEAENQAAIGLNLATHPTQAASALRAKQLNQLIITGPVNLVQGGRAFIGRIPVYLSSGSDGSDNFWGLVSALISPDKLFALSGLSDPDLPVLVSIKHFTGLESEHLFGEKNLTQSNPITGSIHLPYGDWEIAVAPKGGWRQTPANQSLARLIIGIINLIILIPMFIVADLLRKNQSNENRLRDLIELAPIGIALTKLSNRQFIDVNPALLAPTGFSKDEYMRLTNADLTPSEYLEDDKKQMQILRNTGRFGPYEKEHVRKDGSRYPVLLNGLLVTGADNQMYVWTIIEDISRRKKSERLVHEQQVRMEAMSTLGRIGAWEHDFETDKTEWSRMTKTIFGIDNDTEITMGDVDRFYQDEVSRERIFSVVERATTSGIPWQEELLIHRPDGSPLWILSTGRAEFKNGKCIKIYGACQDIQAQVQLRQELIHAKEAAEAATVAKSEFLATMSHEIRTPMNGVLGMLNLLQRDNLQEDQQRKVALAKQSADSLLDLINDILDFSKIEANKLQLESISFHLPLLIENVVETFAVQAQDKGIEIALNLGDMPINHAMGDPNRIRQIFINLINNAIKFTANGSIYVNIHVQAEANFHLLTCEISDTGIGMTEAQQAKLFRAFSQADTSTTRQFGGTGLGLAICKNLCEMMNGSIEVNSKLHAGSTFTFQIQLAHSPADTGPIIPDGADKVLIYFISPYAITLTALRNRCQRWNIGFAGAHIDGAENLRDETLEATRSQRLLLLDCALEETDIQRLAAAPGFADCVKVQMQLARNANLPPVAAEIEAVITKPITRAGLLKLIALVSQERLQTNAMPALQANSQIIWPEHTRLLLVEDNPVNQEVAIMLLEDINLQADIAANGQDALDMLRRSAPNTYQLILMDCQMPVMDGYTASKAIRAGQGGESYRSIPIIALTANALHNDQDRCLAAGMTGYLSKPIDANEFERTLIHWLSKHMMPTITTHTTPAESSEPKPLGVTHTETVTLQPWDEGAALAKVKKPERLKILANTFNSSLPERLGELRAATTAKDWTQVVFIAHGLKGSAGNLCADKLFRASKQLETMAKDFQQQNSTDDQQSTLESTLLLQCEVTMETIEELQRVLTAYTSEAQ